MLTSEHNGRDRVAAAAAAVAQHYEQIAELKSSMEKGRRTLAVCGKEEQLSTHIAHTEQQMRQHPKHTPSAGRSANRDKGPRKINIFHLGNLCSLLGQP